MLEDSEDIKKIVLSDSSLGSEENEKDFVDFCKEGEISAQNNLGQGSF